jgi:hypothetical protein
MDPMELFSECVRTERYLEYPFDGQKGFVHVTDMPKEVAEAWIAAVAEEAGLRRYHWDPTRNGSKLMNKGAVHVDYCKFGRKEIWLANHDGQYSLIQRDPPE